MYERGSLIANQAKHSLTIVNECTKANRQMRKWIIGKPVGIIDIAEWCIGSVRCRNP